MGRLIAIGDIHGYYRKLLNLLEKIDPKEEDQLVFLGDYVDRGPDSYSVVKLLDEFAKDFPKSVFLMGNHEDFIVSLFKGNKNTDAREQWIKINGGGSTLRSYRIAGKYLNIHQDFYMGLQFFHETQEFFFCHAGVRPGVKLAKQRRSNLVSIREPFLRSSENFGKIVVHGHTITDNQNPEFCPNRINIDTGASWGGPLTAIELPSRKIWQV